MTTYAPGDIVLTARVDYGYAIVRLSHVIDDDDSGSHIWACLDLDDAHRHKDGGYCHISETLFQHTIDSLPDPTSDELADA